MNILPNTYHIKITHTNYTECSKSGMMIMQHVSVLVSKMLFADILARNLLYVEYKFHIQKVSRQYARAYVFLDHSSLCINKLYLENFFPLKTCISLRVDIVGTYI